MVWEHKYIVKCTLQVILLPCVAAWHKNRCFDLTLKMQTKPTNKLGKVKMPFAIEWPYSIDLIGIIQRSSRLAFNPQIVVISD
jgi:hypothetical protein